MNRKILDLLYRSFDQQLEPKEQQRLDETLAQSAELRAEQERITRMRVMISDSSVPSFHPFFAEKVMRRIRGAETAMETFWDSLISVFRPIAIAATILFIVLLTYNLFKSDHKSLASALAEPEIKLEHSLDPALALVME